MVISTRFLAMIIVTGTLALAMACSKKEEQKQPAAPPAASVPGIPLKPATAIPDKDKDEARAAAKQVISLLQSGDFAKVYREASPGFKKIGPEADFVARFQQTGMKTGQLSNPQEKSFNTGPDNSLVLIYRLENERYTSDWRISFTRSAGGKLELAGLNQHDELKK